MYRPGSDVSKYLCTNFKLGKFAVKNVVPTAEGDSSKVKLRAKLDIHGIFKLTKAELYEKVPPEPEPEPEKMETDPASNKAEGKDSSVEETGNKEEPENKEETGNDEEKAEEEKNRQSEPQKSENETETTAASEQQVCTVCSNVMNGWTDRDDSQLGQTNLIS